LRQKYQEYLYSCVWTKWYTVSPKAPHGRVRRFYFPDHTTPSTKSVSCFCAAAPFRRRPSLLKSLSCFWQRFSAFCRAGCVSENGRTDNEPGGSTHDLLPGRPFHPGFSRMPPVTVRTGCNSSTAVYFDPAGDGDPYKRAEKHNPSSPKDNGCAHAWQPWVNKIPHRLNVFRP